VEDEKFLKHNGHKTYAVGLVDHRHDLLWWLDYVFETSQNTLQTSFGTLLNWLKLVDPTFYFEGITGDSWLAAKRAFAALDPRTKLAECLLHPMLILRERSGPLCATRTLAERSGRNFDRSLLANLVSSRPT
jgi:hypothetical protein